MVPVKWGRDKVGGARKVGVAVGSGKHGLVSEPKMDFPCDVGDLIVGKRPVRVFCIVGDTRC
jgi:hypothetical protein